MRECPACGTPNPERAKFCQECATPLSAPQAAPEVRKVVSIVFADISGSTELGERLDPESVRQLLTRYFAVMKDALERHGGTVEKFIGDAVMAVFGIPTLHEDDALRAVRAAGEMRDRLAELNKQAQMAATITLRTGVNTGEVVAGDPSVGQTLVTGDAVNTAARLQQAAQPGEILIGQTTYRLVRDAVLADAVEPLAAKGKAEPLAAYRIREVIPGVVGHTRRLDAPIVGRDHELDLLRAGFERCAAEKAGYLFTVIGPAGVGKSRLVQEFLAEAEPTASIVRGRCLPYGDGITYWPLRELVHAAAGIGEGDARDVALDKLGRLVEGDRDARVVASRLATAIGLTPDAVQQDEIFWAVRRLLEHLARERPLVVVIEDIHWAQPTFLDLLEYLTDLVRDVPVLLLCLARPELLDLRSGWGGGKPNATSLLLDPLSLDTTGELLDALPDGRAVPDAVRRRILEAADGNPLYVEEMIGMLVDDGRLSSERGWLGAEDADQMRIPDTIGSLLAARIDGLPDAERSLATRAAVAGRVFEAAAAHELIPAASRPELARTLLALVRKEVLRPERAELTVGDAYKFRHVLIRDAAYEALPKADRAELHERFVSWLEAIARDRLDELAEIAGYHLEHAARYLEELGRADERSHALRERAASHLLNAGIHALEREDGPAAEDLLRRAESLAGEASSSRIEALRNLGYALALLGRHLEREAVSERMLAAAQAAGDEAAALVARLESTFIQAIRDPSRYSEIGPLAETSLARLEQLGDHAATASVSLRLAGVAEHEGRFGDAAIAIDIAERESRLVGNQILASRAAGHRLLTNVMGPPSVPVGLDHVASLQAKAGPVWGAELAGVQVVLRLLQGDTNGSAGEALSAIQAEQSGDWLLWSMLLGFALLVCGRPQEATTEL